MDPPWIPVRIPKIRVPPRAPGWHGNVHVRRDGNAHVDPPNFKYHLLQPESGRSGLLLEIGL